MVCPTIRGNAMAEFFEKIDPTPIELQEFEWVGQRIRKLFAELAQKKAA